MTHHFWHMGDLDRALVSGRRALALATTLDDVRLQVEINFTLGQVYYSLGEYRQAMDGLRRNVVALQGDLLQERFGFSGSLAAFSRNRLAWCLAEVGAFTEGIARNTEALRLAEASVYPYGLIAAHYAVGFLYLRKGDLPQAIPMFERCLALYHTMHLSSWLPAIAAVLGYAYALAGRVAEATPLLKQAIEHVTAVRVLIFHSLAMTWLGETALLVGRLYDAGALADQALAICRKNKERGHEAWVLRLIGDIAAQHKPVEAEQAETRYRQALALADELGMRPLVAHCHLGLGMLYLKGGKEEQARSELFVAIELYRAMDMTFWLPQVEAALAKVG
jgi:tetratricopeptide (TPR) repeat protein